MKKHLLPPRLNEKYLILGCTVIELGITILLGVIAIAKFNGLIMVFASLTAGTSVRFIGDMNVRDYIRLLYKY